VNSIEQLEAPNGKCDICKDAIEPVWGIKGQGETDILIILQSSDYRALEHPGGYTGALLESLTGGDINNMVMEDWRNIAVVNSVKCHFKQEEHWRDPRLKEYRNCSHHLQTQIEELEPELVICSGSWAIKGVFGEENYDSLRPNRYSIQYKEAGNTVYAIATHPRLFTLPIKKKLAETVYNFRRKNEIDMGDSKQLNISPLNLNFSV